ncbi:MAG: ABC transporter ATP-binding protein, partial [Anaerolineae bacterium]|nr:ABC transporter ATP-binding protein [Anaerolineae bacterium]
MGPGRLVRTFGDQTGGKAFDWRITARLLAFLRPHWQRMVAAFVLMLAGSGLSLAIPYLIKVAIDENIAGGDLAGLARTSLLTLAAFLALYVVTAGQQYLLSWVGQRVLATLRAQLVAHLQALSLGYHDTHLIGVTVSRVINDVAIINELLSEGLVTLVGDL